MMQMSHQIRPFEEDHFYSNMLNYIKVLYSV